MQPDPDLPVLSVIVAAWNAATTIETAISSVLGQADVALECIVVDDGSTDATLEVLEAIASRDRRLVVVASPRNEGCSAARNRALAVARGQWYAFLDADDVLLPGGLAAMLGAGIQHDALVVVGQRISTDGARSWFPTLYDLPDIREPGVKSVARNPGLLYYAGPAGKLFHRSCVGGLEFEGRMLGDQPWVVRAILRAGERIVVITDVVYEWRRPRRSEDAPTITSARVQSARLGAEAVRMAAVAFDVVAAELDRAVEPPARQVLAATYFERLVRADLAAQLHAATRRGDPDTGAMLAALRAFLAGVPPSVVAATTAVEREILTPPLRGWGHLPAAARAAYLDLLWTTYRIDPGLTGRSGGRLLGALKTVARLPTPVRDRVAAVLISAAGAMAGISRRPSASSNPAPDERQSAR